jgi:hypothetical protein
MDELDYLTDLKGALLYQMFHEGEKLPRPVSKEVSTLIVAKYADLLNTHE